MKIMITTSSFDVVASEPLRRLVGAGFELHSNPHGRRLTEAEVGGLLEPSVVGMIAGVEPLTRTVLARAPNLKVISRCGIGLDSVDLAAARKQGVRVFNTPDAPSLAVAELALALILNLLRRVSEADQEIRRGRWKALMGSLLQGKSVGIIGYGRIGRKVATLVRAFGATVIAHDTATGNVDADTEACGLDSLLARADIVSLHVPYSDTTHHLLNAQRLACMRTGALLVNASRGGLVDEAALLEALRSGHLGGAALDTLEQEPYNGPLTTVPNVLLTAHMGSYAREARIMMEREAAANLERGLAECGLLPHQSS
jgi:D-3-phosphoglycerate dehydrogenase / 2-oxoglutarate reductase